MMMLVCARCCRPKIDLFVLSNAYARAHGLQARLSSHCTRKRFITFTDIFDFTISLYSAWIRVDYIKFGTRINPQTSESAIWNNLKFYCLKEEKEKSLNTHKNPKPMNKNLWCGSLFIIVNGCCNKFLNVLCAFKGVDKSRKKRKF